MSIAQVRAKFCLFFLGFWVLSPVYFTSPTAVPVDAALVLEQPKLIALTFDDGPRRATTTALLDGLAQRGVQATFFVIGNQIQGQEDILLRMEAEGHQVGLHTLEHVKLEGLSTADFQAQVDTNRDLLSQVLGRSDFLLRPPYGLYDPAVRQNANCPIVLWSIDPKDWEDRDIGRITQDVVQSAKDGDIILMHDIFPESVTAALSIVDQLHDQGYLFVTVTALFEARQRPLEAGEVYTNAWP